MNFKKYKTVEINNVIQKYKHMKTRKNILSLFIAISIMVIPFYGFAQKTECNKQERKKMIESQKMDFITKKMDLTPIESQKFWPYYNEYKAKKDSLMGLFHKECMCGKKDFSQLSDKQAEKLADMQIIHAQQMLDLRKEYHQKFKSVLPAKKVLKLYNKKQQIFWIRN